MLSIEELIREVSSIKLTSDELAVMVGAAGQTLSRNVVSIAALVKGSRSGQDAVTSVNIAAKSLIDAASSIKTLSRTCDECIANLSK